MNAQMSSCEWMEEQNRKDHYDEEMRYAYNTFGEDFHGPSYKVGYDLGYEQAEKDAKEFERTKLFELSQEVNNLRHILMHYDYKLKEEKQKELAKLEFAAKEKAHQAEIDKLKLLMV